MWYLIFTGIWEGGMLSGLGSFALILALAFSRNPEGKDDGKRFMYLNGLALCTGKHPRPQSLIGSDSFYRLSNSWIPMSLAVLEWLSLLSELCAIRVWTKMHKDGYAKDIDAKRLDKKRYSLFFQLQGMLKLG